MTKETTDNAETSTEDISGLKNKNRELHGIIKDLEKQVSKLTDDVTDAAENARSETGSELDKANRQITKLTKERDDAITNSEQSAKNLRSYREEAAIANIIASNNVQPDDVRAVKAIIKMEMDRDSDEPSIGGTSLDNWGKSFFAKEGKRYVSASDHSGGGATGSEGSKATRMIKENFNFTDFAKIQLENPAEANAIADAVGRPGLKTDL